MARRSLVVLISTLSLGLLGETRDAPASLSRALRPEACAFTKAPVAAYQATVSSGGDSSRSIRRKPTPERIPQEVYARLNQLEDCIIGLAEGRSLSELRPTLLALYPELSTEIPDPRAFSTPMSFRQAASLLRLRREITPVVLADYAVLEEAMSDAQERSGG